jgi:hypothetical protein
MSLIPRKKKRKINNRKRKKKKRLCLWRKKGKRNHPTLAPQSILSIAHGAREGFYAPYSPPSLHPFRWNEPFFYWIEIY